MENKHILVSISCITYNHAPYIRQCLDGFLMQKTNFGFEILIHDDCSTDGTTEIIKEYEAKYPNIIKPIYEDVNQYQQGKPSGSAVWNFPRAQGNYIALCEGDDYWIDPLKLQKQVDFLEAHSDYSMCFHNAYYQRLGKIYGRHKIYGNNRKAKTSHIVRDGGFIPTLSIVFRRSILDNYHLFPDNCPVGDLRIQTYASLLGNVYYINESMGVYRQIASSLTHMKMNNNDSYINHQERFIEWYKRVDEYTDYQYPDIINESISFAEARIARKKEQYLKFWSRRYWKYLMSVPFKTRIGIMAGMFGLKIIPRAGQKLLKIIRNSY